MKLPITQTTIAARFILSLVFIVILTWAGWNSINLVGPAASDVDSGTYSAIGFHVLHGYVPYRDIFEQKQPLIFFIEAFALWITEESIAGIRDVERVCGCLRAVLFFLIVRKAFGGVWLAGLASCAFLAYFYSQRVFQGGNLTEEYANVFLLCGVYASQWVRVSVGARAQWLCAATGIFLSLTVLTKEPFAFSCLPWAAFAIVKRDGGFKGLIARAVSLGAGGLFPVSIFVAYFAWHRALEYWLDALFFSFSYVSVQGVGLGFQQKLLNNWNFFSGFVLEHSAILNIATYVGITAGVLTPLMRRTGNIFIPAACAQLVLDFYATMLSGMGYGHYYMQIVPSFILVAACGFGFIQAVVEKRIPLAGLVFLLAGVVGVRELNAEFFNTWYKNLHLPYHRYRADDPIARHIRENSEPSDRMWQAPYNTTRLYLEAGRLSPVPYLYIHDFLKKDTLLTTGEQKIQGIIEGLKTRRPKFIVIKSSEAEYFGLAEWLQSNYRNTGVGDGSGTRLFVRIS